MKFKKKPVAIEAFRFGVDEYPEWFKTAIEDGTVTLISNQLCFIKTLEGEHRAEDCYIIQGIKGELYPCRADIFLQTYDKV